MQDLRFSPLPKEEVSPFYHSHQASCTSLSSSARRHVTTSHTQKIKDKREKKEARKLKRAKNTKNPQTDRVCEEKWLEALVIKAKQQKNTLSPRCAFDLFLTVKLAPAILCLTGVCGLLLNCSFILDIVRFFQLKE